MDSDESPCDLYLFILLIIWFVARERTTCMNARKNRLPVSSDVSDVEDYDIERVLQLLADEETRTLFQQLSSPKTTRELISECDIARSTAYRKITELENAGLLIEVDHVDDSKQPTAYVRPLEEIVLRVGDTLTIDVILELDHELSSESTCL